MLPTYILDHGAIRYDAVLWDDHYPVANDISFVRTCRGGPLWPPLSGNRQGPPRRGGHGGPPLHASDIHSRSRCRPV